MELFYSKIRNFFLLVFLLLLLNNCSDEKYPIPNVTVNVYVDPVTLSQIGIGTSAYCPVSGGIKGIIIYHESQDSYIAFERLCTNYPNDECAIEIEKDNSLQAKCPCCGSEFSLWTGDVLNPPAKYALKRYKTYLSGNRLYIAN